MQISKSIRPILNVIFVLTTLIAAGHHSSATPVGKEESLGAVDKPPKGGLIVEEKSKSASAKKTSLKSNEKAADLVETELQKKTRFGGSPTAIATLTPVNVATVTISPSKMAIEKEQRRSDEIRAGDTVEVRLKLKIDPGFHAYVDQYKFSLASAEKFYLSEFQIQPTVKFNDPVSKKVKIGTEDFAEMTSLLDVPTQAVPGLHKLKFALTYQACGPDFCLFPKTIEFEKDLDIASSETNVVANALARGWWYALLIVFFAGVLTSLTPCIFPMIPITMAVLGATDTSRSRRQGFFISLFYVFGIAFTYAILGVAAARTGALFGSLLGSPLVVGTIALIFVLMALSMFGLFEIRPPSFITNRLGGAKTEKNLVGAFISGLIAGVVASPCVGPVLIGILAYVAQTQNTKVGFILLFTFALGMGQLFLLLGTFNTFIQRLPRSGAWMEKVKTVFGVIMLGMALYYIYPVVPKSFLAKFRPGSASEETVNVPKPQWQPYSEELLAAAIHDKRPVIVDFNAEWCLACKELETYTFSDPRIIGLGAKFLWLTFDATSPSDPLTALQKKYGIGGLPYVLIFDNHGKQRSDLTLTGFEDADHFLARMNRALN